MGKKYLEDQAHIFEKINKAINNSVYIFDLNEQCIVWLNERGEELSGYSASEIRAMGSHYYSNLMHPADIPLLMETINKAKNLSEGEVINFEYRMKDRQGVFHWINDRLTTFSRDDSGNVTSVLGVSTDIDHRKAYEEDLKKTIEKLNFSLSAAKMGTWEWDIASNSLTWDKRMYEIHDLVPEECASPMEEIWRRVDRQEMEAVNLKVQEAAAKKQDFYVTYRTTYRNGEVHHLRFYGTFISLDGDRMYGVGWDSTVEVQTERQIEEAKARLISSTKMAALGEMSGGIAHEINNPLTVIQARSFQLSQMVENNKMDPDKVKQAAESISRTADKIAKIIKSLRSFAREGTYDPFEIVSVKKIIEETLEFCRTRFYNHGVEIEVPEIDPELEVECRLIQIEQVILNLLNNSFDAIQSLENKWIRLKVLDLPEAIEISVSDSGSGISADLQDQIMLPFFTTKEVGKGTGLGLSISAGIVRSHRGTLTLDSKSPHTSFVIHLPKWQGENEESSVTETKAY